MAILRTPRALAPRGESVRRLFLVYAVASLVPVLALGAVLFVVGHRSSEQRGLAEARNEADVIARIDVAPVLARADLARGLTAEQRTQLRRISRLAVSGGDVLRLRIHDLRGAIVFADDGSGATGPVDDDAVDAAHGQVVSSLTRLNSDADDSGPSGPRVVEVYEPIDAPGTQRPVGVLETYLPFAPIAAQVSAQQRAVMVLLSSGLALLWLVLLAVSFSVTRRLQRQLERTRFLAGHDALTGLPNRDAFDRAVAGVLAEPGVGSVGVALVDLDSFRHINDVFGHDKGDLVLAELARRLRATLPDGDQVFRLGGDEFGLLLRGDPDAVPAQLAAVRASIGEPIDVVGAPVVVEAGVGYAMAPADGTSGVALLGNADLAVHAAKGQQLGIARYRPELNKVDAAALALVAELRAAIDDDQLVLHYQPKGDLTLGTAPEVEALVRWQHPARGLLFPDAFIPLAEQTELVDLLTQWVVRTAVNALDVIDPGGHIAVAVNVSARSLARPDFAGELLAVLDEANVSTARLVVEITETAIMADPVAAAATLERLGAAGVRVSVDDFGAGQTSLASLAALPVTELKIDKAFVLPMLGDPRKDAIVRSVVHLGHSLGCVVTAEGVEDAATLARLRELDCDKAQGYHLARPVPLAELGRAITATETALGGACLVPARALPAMITNS